MQHSAAPDGNRGHNAERGACPEQHNAMPMPTTPGIEGDGPSIPSNKNSLLKASTFPCFEKGLIRPMAPWQNLLALKVSTFCFMIGVDPRRPSAWQGSHSGGGQPFALLTGVDPPDPRGKDLFSGFKLSHCI